MGNNIVLKIDNLKKYFKSNKGTVKAVDGISLEIQKGDTFGLVGESGCGKSTFIRTILKLINQTEGKIFFRDEDISSFDKKIAILFEYDALPTIGHGCGHNMISAISYGASLALSKIKELNGDVFVVGCPGEENGGGKVILANEGIFDDLDAAIMVHPATENKVYSTSLALDAIKFSYKGQTTHASSTPEKGINSLDAIIHLFNRINYLRQYVKDWTRVHGIISNGGDAPNVIPDYAEAKFYFRAKTREYLDEVVKKAVNIAEGSSKMTGAKLSWEYYELSNDDLKPSKKLSEIFKQNYYDLGIKDIEPDSEGGGSTDVGNVSHIIPAIHPYISIAPKHSISGHTVEFREVTLSERERSNFTCSKSNSFYRN
jgi:amidohydrolase